MYRSPKYWKEMARLRKLHEQQVTSSQAGGGKRPIPEPRAQASSQSSQAQQSHDQGTSAQAHDPGRKQQG